MPEAFVSYMVEQAGDTPCNLEIAWGWRADQRTSEDAEYTTPAYDVSLENSDRLRSLREDLKRSGVVQLEADGFESRDVIATRVSEIEGPTIVHSTDRSLLQIVSDACVLIDPLEGESRDRWAVRSEFGVDPERLGEALSLLGEPLRSIPGLKDVARSHVEESIRDSNSLEDMYEGRLSHFDLDERTKVRMFRRTAEKNKVRLSLDNDVDLEVEEPSEEDEAASLELDVFEKLRSAVNRKGFVRSNDASIVH